MKIVNGIPQHTDIELKRAARAVEEEARWRTGIVLAAMANEALHPRKRLEVPGHGRYTDRPE